MNVLSLFDGMSCGQLALNQLGVKVDNYYASEIDTYAMQITQKNFPDTIQLGDVTQVNNPHTNPIDSYVDLPQIDLLLGGSPCQGFSFSGKQLAFDDPRSKLFFEFVRLLKELKPKYFLLENVKMKKEYQDIITDQLGVEPIFINSALVSAQNRQRLYWTNIPNITQPDDRNILLKDILQHEVENEYTEPYVKLNGKESGCVGYVGNKPAQATRIYSDDYKSQSLLANGGGQGGKTGLYQIRGGAYRGRYEPDGSIKQQLEVRKDEKTNTLTSVQKDNVLVHEMVDRDKSFCIDANYHKGGNLQSYYGKHRRQLVFKGTSFFYRKLTPVECERLQTVPDGYTEGVSNTQRYRMLGNGWTVEVIKHILKGVA